jgi:hypothetical protein
LAPKSRRRRFENDSAFLAAVGFLKMTRLFEKADQLLAMSRGNVITGLTFSRHSSGVSGSFRAIYFIIIQLRIVRILTAFCTRCLCLVQ